MDHLKSYCYRSLPSGKVGPIVTYTHISAHRVIECKGGVWADLQNGRRLRSPDSFELYRGPKSSKVMRKLKTPIITAAIYSSNNEKEIGINFWQATEISKKGPNWELVCSLNFIEWMSAEDNLKYNKKQLKQAQMLVSSETFVPGAMLSVINGEEMLDKPSYYDLFFDLSGISQEADDLFRRIVPFSHFFNPDVYYYVESSLEKTKQALLNHLDNPFLDVYATDDHKTVVRYSPWEYEDMYYLDQVFCEFAAAGCVDKICVSWDGHSPAEALSEVKTLDTVMIYDVPIFVVPEQ